MGNYAHDKFRRLVYGPVPWGELREWPSPENRAEYVLLISLLKGSGEHLIHVDGFTGAQALEDFRQVYPELTDAEGDILLQELIAKRYVRRMDRSDLYAVVTGEIYTDVLRAAQAALRGEPVDMWRGEPPFILNESQPPGPYQQLLEWRERADKHLAWLLSLDQQDRDYVVAVLLLMVRRPEISARAVVALPIGARPGQYDELFAEDVPVLRLVLAQYDVYQGLKEG
jgi:hypothetical protein